VQYVLEARDQTESRSDQADSEVVSQSIRR
jgi:hypothetical protein